MRRLGHSTASHCSTFSHQIATPMFSSTADLYDEVYSFKDYAAEAAKIRSLIATERPGACSILDVGCGTGSHAKELSDAFEVDGIDIDPTFVNIAQAKVPKGNFSVANMTSFNLDRKYDVVQCLFSSIGYLLTAADIVAAFRCFAGQLTPGGVILVEPWLSPEAFQPGLPRMLVVDKPELKICRMNVSERDGDVSVLRFHYLIATPQGVRAAEECHRLALVTPERMAEHFAEAGLTSSFDPVGVFGRGLFVARMASDNLAAD
ncbi:class I SAM-dependent methyltransferase [Anatilimnocola sp. NA78]|uniref:class I SAM-dependent DNA methyltransferase n=1 Tax=Anatilimnocola sp. NA78 TaxID=3415683 RepID=UPI003CE59199